MCIGCWPLRASSCRNHWVRRVERAAVDRDRRAGQDVDPGDRHAQRQVGRLALQFARDLLHSMVVS